MKPSNPDELTKTTVVVSAAGLTDVTAEVLHAVGAPEAAAATVASSLVEADRAGISSHGVMLLPMYVERIRRGSVDPAVEARIVSDRGGVVVLDGRHALGQLVGDRAVVLACERAGRHGLGLVAVRHGFHFGTARRYAVAAARTGCVALVMCNTRPLMPAPGGAERVVGNNPLAIALPVEGGAPFVLDIALSEAAMGKIRAAHEAGRPIPRTWATDARSSPTTDPGEAIEGMLLPVGGHKGFALALTIDLLCGALSSGAWGDSVQPLYGDPAVPYDCAQLFLAIDVSFARPLDEFTAEITRAVDRLHSSARAPGVERLYHPGELAWRRHEASSDRVELEATIIASMRRCAAETGIAVLDRLDEAGGAIDDHQHDRGGVQP